MNVLTDEVVNKVLELSVSSLSKCGDLIIGKQIIVAAFSEIVENRQKEKNILQENMAVGGNSSKFTMQAHLLNDGEVALKS